MYISGSIFLPRPGEGVPAFDKAFINYMLGAYPYDKALALREVRYGGMPHTMEYPYDKFPNTDEAFCAMKELSYKLHDGELPGKMLMAYGALGGQYIDRPFLEMPYGTEGALTVHRDLVPMDDNDPKYPASDYAERWSFVGGLRDRDSGYLPYVRDWWEVLCTVLHGVSYASLKVSCYHEDVDDDRDTFFGDLSDETNWAHTAGILERQNSKLVNKAGLIIGMVRIPYSREYDKYYDWLKELPGDGGDVDGQS